MKVCTIAVFFAVCTAANSVFAAEVANSSSNVAATKANLAVLTKSASTGDAVAPSGSDVVHGAGKTRAEVYQELVRAERDGSFARVNRTLYRGN